MSVVQAEETIYVTYGSMDSHEAHVGILDLPTGSFGDIDATTHNELIELLGNSHMEPIMAEGYNADSMVIYTADGVYEYSSGNTQKLIDEQESTVLSNPAISTIGIVFDSEDDFFLISVGQYTPGETPQFLLHKCTKTVGDQVGSETTSKLRVWSLEDSDTLRQGIALFKDEHPYVEMELEIGVSAEGITPEDAIRVLNVEVLAGSGPDVFILDGLQIDSFIEQGQLHDLADVYVEAKDSGLYYDNIIGAFADQGEIQVIPLRYSFPLVVADQSTVARLESLPSLVSLSQEIYENNPETRLFCNASIIDESFIASYPEIITGATINKEALEQFFDCSEDLYEILEQNNRERCVLPNSSREPFGENEYFDMPPRASHYLHEDPTQILMNLVSMESDFALNEIYIQNSEVDFASDVLVFNQFKCFAPSNCVAINADSSEVELSKSFIRMLLNDEIQSVNHNEGLSVSKSTLNNLVGESFAVSFEDNSSFVLESLQEETVASYQSLIASLDTPVVVDEVVQAAIYEELQRYLEGEITKDEALDNCTKRIDLYLSE